MHCFKWLSNRSKRKLFGNSSRLLSYAIRDPWIDGHHSFFSVFFFFTSLHGNFPILAHCKRLVHSNSKPQALKKAPSPCLGRAQKDFYKCIEQDLEGLE